MTPEIFFATIGIFLCCVVIFEVIYFLYALIKLVKALQNGDEISKKEIEFYENNKDKLN